MTSRHEAEAERQRQLLALLLADRANASALATRESDARALRGLQAYRANADASAARALGTAFATVAAMVGEEDFSHLARSYWRHEPPARGDLGAWGDGFADWIGAHPALAEWPYLGDCARLDWAIPVGERAEDAVLDAPSIARLGDTDPSRLRLLLAPGVAALQSPWPIALILDAHRRNDDAAFGEVRTALEAERGECVLVARRGWRAVVTTIDAATADWTHLLLARTDLATAMAQAGEGFDFAVWLATALQSGWVKGIDVVPD